MVSILLEQLLNSRVNTASASNGPDAGIQSD